MRAKVCSSLKWASVALGLLTFVLAVPIAAQAQSTANMGIQCTGSTTCTDGATSLITSTSTPTFNIIKTGGTVSGTVFLAVMVPNGAATFSVMVGATTIAAEESITFTSGMLGDVGNLNEPKLSDFNFSAVASASTQAGIAAPGSFTVYEYNLGAAAATCGSGGVCVSNISVGPLPIGTVIVAWVEDGSGNALARTSLSKSLTVVPEPGTLVLLGSGLIVAGGFLRRRFGHLVGRVD